eukprot:9026123-Karenia_brevis.AAC.1
MAAEATEMLHDVRECYVQGCLPALERKFDWIPLLLRDGNLPGSWVLKRYCEQCSTMPVVAGQWLLFEKHNGKQ